MKRRRTCFLVAFCLSLVHLTSAQTSTETASALPRLIRFGGAVKGPDGSPLTGVAGITFALYSEPTGGAALWLETQNVTADSNGRYTALLGATKPEGLPAELFNSEQARWVGVQVQGQPEQPRVLLVSAPYALKAGDAETIGGLPPSAFVLAAPPASGPAAANGPAAIAAGSRDVTQATATDVTTTGGTANYLPFFTGASTILDSAVFQTGTGSTAKIGINTSAPAATLDVKGNAIVAGTLILPETGIATSTVGDNSQSLDMTASVFNSGTSTAVSQTFQLKAEPVGNDTATAGGALSLLYGSGTSAPAETGLKIASDGQITFAAGQAFPGTGSGTVTSVASGTGLTGGPITGSGTLSLAANACASGSALTALPFTCSPFATLGANVFTGNQTVSGTLTATSFSGSGAALTNVTASNSNELGGLAPSAFAQLAAANAFTQGAFFFGSVSSIVPTAGATAVYGSAIGTGTLGSPTIGVKGISSGTDSNGVVADETGPGGYGVYAHASGAQDLTRYNPIGVYGLADSGDGVLGVAVSNSATYAFLTGSLVTFTAGVWGDTSAAAGANQLAGIVGTADNQSAAYFANNSSTVSTVIASNLSDGDTGLFKTFKASTRTGACGIGGDGDLTCTGQVKTLATTGGGAQTVETYAMQSAENWMEDFGSGTLERGVAVVKLDQAFAETVSGTADYHVFITPNGDSKGLYVIGKTTAGFEVHESGGGTSSVSFDYRIVAKRRGYESQRLTDVTERFNAEQESLNRLLKIQSGAAPARLSRPAAQAGTAPVSLKAPPAPRE